MDKRLYCYLYRSFFDFTYLLYLNGNDRCICCDNIFSFYESGWISNRNFYYWGFNRAAFYWTLYPIDWSEANFSYWFTLFYISYSFIFHPFQHLFSIF